MAVRLNSEQDVVTDVYERDKKVTLVGETNSEGKLFITGYQKEDSTMSAQTPRVDIGSAGTLTPPFPSGATANAAEVPIATEVPIARDTNAEVVPAPDASVPPPPLPEPETTASVPPLTEEKIQGGRKSRRYKKTGKKQKGRKSRKQRKQRK